MHHSFVGMSVRTWTLIVCVTLWHCFTSSSAIPQCPSVCQCNWVNGKTTARCNQAQLITVPNDFLNLTQVLYLEDSNLQVMPSRVFQSRGLTNLQKIFLARSKIAQIQSDAFQRLTNLVELDLSGNLLTQVPSDALAQIGSLRRLRLDGNPLKRIRSGAFSSLSQLNYLNLSSAQLDTLEPDAFEGLTKLQYLMLDGNRLTTLSEHVLARLPPVFTLKLHANPWNCDCELRPARRWLETNNIHLEVKPLCAAPAALIGQAMDRLPVQQFACVPVMLPVDRRPSVSAGSTALLQCQVRAVAESTLAWRVQLDNGSWALVTESSDPPRLSDSYNDYSPYSSAPLITSHSNHLLDGRIQLIAPLQSPEDEHILIGQLRVRNISSYDTGRRFACIATNEAGSAALNFTLHVQPGSALAGTASAMAGAVAGSGGLFWLLLLLCAAACVLAIVGFVANRRLLCFNGSESDQAGSMNKSALPSLDVLKHVGNGHHGGSSTGNHDHNRMNGTNNSNLMHSNSLDKRSLNGMNGLLPNAAKQMENASSSGYGSNGVTPDLTSCVLKMQHSASYAQLAANVGCPPTDLSNVHGQQHEFGYVQTNPHVSDTYGYLQPNQHGGEFASYLQPIESSSHATYGGQMYVPSHHGYPQHLQHLQQPTIANYENMYESNGAYASQPMLIGAGPSDAVPGYSSSGAYGAPSTVDAVGYSIDNGPMYWSNNGSSSAPKPNDQPSGSGSMNGTSGGHVNLLPQPYLAAQPTVVRYSPDEGYAEETANTPFTLEGTEV
jgi:hypothetical protein